jgi:hypothetical protein
MKSVTSPVSIHVHTAKSRILRQAGEVRVGLSSSSARSVPLLPVRPIKVKRVDAVMDTTVPMRFVQTDGEVGQGRGG